jgi:hypothetical protein
VNAAQRRREDVAAGLEMLAARLRSDPLLPDPSPSWPLTFQAADPDHMAYLVVALGVQDAVRTEHQDEDGWPWEQVTGHASGVPVRITADAGARVLTVLEDMAAANLAGSRALLHQIAGGAA